MRDIVWFATNEPDLTRAVDRCHRVLREASENGRLGPKRLIVGGFSQGACLSIEYAIRHPGQCAAILVFTGGLIGAGNRSMRGPVLKGLKVFLTGSDVDDWIPEENCRQTADILAEHGADVTLRLYPGRKHVVSETELADAREFLAGL